MHQTQAKVNTHFAHLFFATLTECGLETVLIAPGSRSSPLALAAKHYAKELFVHFDERSLAFMAVGKIKASKKPVALITTSGTAVANLLPALMEAYHQNLPLILITADRPAEDHHVGANQTVCQEGLFSNYTHFEHFFDAPSSGFHERALTSLLSFVIYASKKGPIHLNVPLKEPLFDPSVDFPHDVTCRKELTCLDSSLYLGKKGVILLGEHSCPSEEMANLYEQLSKKLNLPLFADITSGFRAYGKLSAPYYPLIADSELFNPDFILHFGEKLISKSVERMIARLEGYYIHFTDSDSLYDPIHRIDMTVRGNLKELAETLVEPESVEEKEPWTQALESLRPHIQSLIENYPSYEEAMYVEALAEHLPKNSALFIGTSLPIRHADTFFFPKDPCGKIYTQRGASGIDGLISTAAGIASEGTLTFALLGDLSSLYDLSALSLISTYKLPLIPIIFNNHGGGIFNYLPIAKQTDDFARLIATEHKFNFKRIAEGFELDYLLISSLEEWMDWLKNPSSFTLVEIISCKEGNPKFLESIKHHVCSLLNHALAPPSPLSSSTDSLDAIGTGLNFSNQASSPLVTSIYPDMVNPSPLPH